MGRKLIFIVDDEALITSPLKRLMNRQLKRPDYEINDENDPTKALEDLKACQAQGDELALIISDIMMPQMNGLAFLSEVKAIYPQTPRIVMTGYADKQNAIQALNELHLFHYVEKPWDNESVVKLVLNALEKYRQDRIEQMFRMYVPYEVIELLVDQDDKNFLEGQEIEVATVLFLDIVGFTKLTENMPAGEIVRLLNYYFCGMIDIIHEHGGILDKFIGDGLMALFGVPLSPDDDPSADAVNAVLTAMDIIKEVEKLNAEYRDDLDGQNIRVRIGINTGKIVAGNIGSATRVNYTAISDVVNTASRIESKARDVIEQDELGCVLIGKPTYDRVKQRLDGRVSFQAQGPVHLRGMESPLELYRVGLCK